MKLPVLFLIGCLLPGVVSAQADIPLLLPGEKEAVDAQADAFNLALEPVLATAAKSTVRVWSGKRRLAYGTVVRDGREVLTKLSELAQANRGLVVEDGSGQVRAARVSGLYPDEDLALLALEGDPLTPVQWASEAPKLGSFLAAPQPGGKPAAFGVVSVLQRNLRETDKAFLGVQGEFGFSGPGVKVQAVTESSGAAEAGLRRGDIIEQVDGRAISGVLELRNSLTGREPGEKVQMKVKRGERDLTLDVVLGNRPNLQQFPGARLSAMERMGTRTSRVRSSFSNVIQSDMRPSPDQIGGPVVDLEGRVVGITMARADRTRSFVMPAEAVIKLLETPAIDPTVARAGDAGVPEREAGMPDVPRNLLPQGAPPLDADRMRRHVEEMQRLMNLLRDEMELLEPLER